MIKTEISRNRTFLMGLSMISIILFHHGWTIIPGITAFFSRFGLWGVDIFLFLSGFGCAYALEKYTTSVFFKKRIIRLLPTCLLAGILIIAIDSYVSAERTQAPLLFKLFSLQRWYIQAILVCYGLCPLAFFIIKHYKWKALLSLVLLCVTAGTFVPSIGFFKLSWIISRIPVFLIGIYVALFDLKLDKKLIIISAFSLCFAVYLRLWGSLGFLSWPYLLAIAIPLLCLLLGRLSDFAERLSVKGLVEVFGLYSLEIYLIHEYCYWALYPVEIALFLKYILFCAIVGLLCCALHISSAKLSNILYSVR